MRFCLFDRFGQGRRMNGTLRITLLQVLDRQPAPVCRILFVEERLYRDQRLLDDVIETELETAGLVPVGYRQHAGL